MLVLLTCSVDRRGIECGSKIVSANVNAEPSCEFVASYSQKLLPGGSFVAVSSSYNSLPGGSFMEVNTDMKKALRGDFLLCTWMLLQHQTKQGLSSPKFPRDVSLREKWVNSIKRKDFIPEQYRVCSQHFYGAQK